LQVILLTTLKDDWASPKSKVKLVEPRGIEPLTSTLPVLRSPS
jgi:hypothetical protein